MVGNQTIYLQKSSIANLEYIEKIWEITNGSHKSKKLRIVSINLFIGIMMAKLHSMLRLKPYDCDRERIWQARRVANVRLYTDWTRISHRSHKSSLL